MINVVKNKDFKNFYFLSYLDRNIFWQDSIANQFFYFWLLEAAESVHALLIASVIRHL